MFVKRKNERERPSEAGEQAPADKDVGMPTEKYKKLGRTFLNFGIVSSQQYSLWRGSDHLLLVKNAHFTEQCRRFFFRDIQAFIIQRTQVNLIFSLCFLAFLLLFSVLSFYAKGGMQTIWLSLTVASFLLLAWNLLAGPTCNCFIRTGIQTEKLPNYTRVRRALRFIKQITPVIEAAQTSLPALSEVLEDPEEWSRVQTMLMPAAEQTTTSTSIADDGQNAVPQRRLFPYLLGIFLVLTGLLWGMNALFPGILLSCIAGLCLVLTVIPALGCLIATIRRGLSASTSRLLAVAAGWVLTANLANYLIFIFAAVFFQQPREKVDFSQTTLNQLKAYGRLMIGGGYAADIQYGIWICELVVAGIFLAFGLACLLGLFRDPGFHETSPAPQPGGPPPLPQSKNEAV